MVSKLYAKWMYAWEYALTTRDSNRVERPLEWGFDHLADLQHGIPIAAGRRRAARFVNEQRCQF